MKTILVDAAGTFVIEGEGIYKPLYELLETYPNRKIIVTNANEEQKVKFGLINLPYELFTLSNNPSKINQQYFYNMLNHFGLQTSDVVYFEHNEEAVKSAQSVGITSYFYDAGKKDLVALKSFLDENL